MADASPAYDFQFSSVLFCFVSSCFVFNGDETWEKRQRRITARKPEHGREREHTCLVWLSK